MKPNTHLNINNSLCGKVTKLEENYAEVLLHTTQQMSADSQGLVHGLDHDFYDETITPFGIFLPDFSETYLYMTQTYARSDFIVDTYELC